VKFPRAYQDEYRYLLAKYLFVQSGRFEVERMRAKEVKQGKKFEEAGAFNFAENAGEFNFEQQGFEFGDTESFDFGGGAGGGDAGGGGFDFGGGGGGAKSGGDAGGGGFDFGGGGGGAKSGGDAGGGGFDFGGGGDKGGGDKGGGDAGGFDFGAPAGGDAKPGPDAKKAKTEADAPVREDAPTTAKEAAKQGIDLIREVKEEGKLGPRALYLRGLLHFINDEPQDAVNAFQKVVQLLNPRQSVRLDPVLRENAFLSLARIHYGHKQFDRSAYYYDMIDRDSANWLTALFEASWAYYRRGDYEKALGNLLTLHSPFFEREYFPESQIVKAIIYFEACRYVETRDLMDGFIDRFTKVMEEIQKIAESKESAEQLYESINKLQARSSEGGDDTTTRIVSLALNDPEISRAQAVVKQVEDQIAAWNQLPDDFRTGKLGREVLDQLKATLEKEKRAAGEVTRSKFEEKLYALKSLLAQAFRIKIEVARAERDAIERRMRGEAVGDEIVPATPRTVVGDEYLYWPYEGEYWRDELGTYQLDFSMCKVASGDE
jgi:tetratricopeptide (TPR) repeat protein